jgi:hypothetical protein
MMCNSRPERLPLGTHPLEEVFDWVQVFPARQLDCFIRPDDARRLKKVPRVLCKRRPDARHRGQASAWLLALRALRAVTDRSGAT